MILLPIDIIRYIIDYIDDPDIRRYFGVYNKINLLKFKFLNSITNFCSHVVDNTIIENNLFIKNIDKLLICDSTNDIVHIRILKKILIKKKFVYYDIIIINKYMYGEDYSLRIFNDNYFLY